MENKKIIISDILNKVGIPCNLKGYSYLMEAVELAVNDFDIVHRITKELYPSIAKKFDSKPSRVERAIRHAIEVSFNRCKLNTLKDVFGNTISITNRKLTNSEFIATIANKILLSQEMK